MTPASALQDCRRACQRTLPDGLHPVHDDDGAVGREQRLVHPALRPLVVEHPAPLIEVCDHQQRQAAPLVDPLDGITPAGADPKVGDLRLQRDEARPLLGADLRPKSRGDGGDHSRERRCEGERTAGRKEARRRARGVLRRALPAAAASISTHGGRRVPPCGLSRHGAFAKQAAGLRSDRAHRAARGGSMRPGRKLKVIVTRRLPREIEARMMELFDTRLNEDDWAARPRGHGEGCGRG